MNINNILNAHISILLCLLNTSAHAYGLYQYTTKGYKYIIIVF